jgi:hypothetical protein
LLEEDEELGADELLDALAACGTNGFIALIDDIFFSPPRFATREY